MPKRKSPVVKIIEALTEVDLVEAESLVELAKALLKEKAKRAPEEPRKAFIRKSDEGKP